MPLFARSKKNPDQGLAKQTGVETENSYLPPVDHFSATQRKGNQSMLREIHEKVGMTIIPRRRDIVRMFGEPNKRSRHYSDLLGKLDDLNRYLDSTQVAESRDEMDRQLDDVLGLMGELERTVIRFIEAKGERSKRADYMGRFMLPVIRNVRANMIAKIIDYRMKPPAFPPKWYQVAATPLTKNIRLDDSMATGDTAKGGINQVRFYRLDASREGVFKEAKKEIKDKKLYGKYAEEMLSDEEKTEYDTAVKAGIKISHQGRHTDPHLAQRNVALYRLNKLLGEDLIPWTELATKLSGKDKMQGSIMQKVKGISAGDAANKGLISVDGPVDGDPSKINIKDPNLQRLLSKLQLLDALAFQVDRHAGNWFIEQDEKGAVTGIKGIDNDMAFGLKTDIHNTKFSYARMYAGVGSFVDKDMADRVMAIRPEDLAAALGDLLNQEELDALVERLKKIQQQLSKVRLLKPDEWNDETAEEMLKEQQGSVAWTSYYGRMYQILKSKSYTSQW